MTGYQEGVIKMSWASVSYLLANATITATLPGFAPYFTAIQTTLPLLQIATAQQEADKSGDTDNKKLLRTTLITQSMDIVRRGVAYGTNVNNSAFLALIGYSESELNKASDTKLVGICQVIHDTANGQVANLTTYGVTAAILTTQQTSITSFNTAIPKDRVDVTDSGSATKLIATYIKTLLTNWEKIDTLVEIVKTTQVGFYNEYHKVRKVIDTGAGSLSLKIQATETVSGNGVANVTLSVSPASTQMKAMSSSNKKADVKKTASGGGAHYKSLPDGDYVVTAIKPGFKDVTLNVSVVNGEYTVLEIMMEKA
jgi:hypothetical protein